MELTASESASASMQMVYLGQSFLLPASDYTRILKKYKDYCNNNPLDSKRKCCGQQSFREWVGPNLFKLIENSGIEWQTVLLGGLVDIPTGSVNREKAINILTDVFRLLLLLQVRCRDAVVNSLNDECWEKIVAAVTAWSDIEEIHAALCVSDDCWKIGLPPLAPEFNHVECFYLRDQVALRLEFLRDFAAGTRKQEGS